MKKIISYFIIIIISCLLLACDKPKTEFENAVEARNGTSFTMTITSIIVMDEVTEEEDPVVIYYEEGRFYLETPNLNNENYIELIDDKCYGYGKVNDQTNLYTCDSIGDLLDEGGIFQFDKIALFQESDFQKEDDWYIRDFLGAETLFPYLAEKTYRPDGAVEGTSLKLKIKIANNVIETVVVEILDPTYSWSKFTMTYTFSQVGSTVVSEPQWVTNYKNSNP